MSWIQKEIERYEEAERTLVLVPIPSELQVGKILKEFKGDVPKSRQFINDQISDDGRMSFDTGSISSSGSWNIGPGWDNNYWMEVLRRFDALMERDLNKIITEP